MYLILSRFGEEPAKMPRIRHVAAAVVAAVAAAVAVSPAAANPPIGEEQAEAERVLARVDELDHELVEAAEAYNGATLHLQRTTKALNGNTRLLDVARGHLKHAQAAIAKPGRAALHDGDRPALAEIVLGTRLGKARPAA